MTVKNFDQKGASLFGLPVSDKSGGLNLLGKGSSGNIGLGKGDDIAQPGAIAPSLGTQPGIAPERDRRDIEDSSENHDADADDIYAFDPGNSFYHYGYYSDMAGNGGIDTFRLTGVVANKVCVRRGQTDSRVFIEAYDNSFTLKVQLSGDNAIERVHFDKNRNGSEDDGDDNILTNDELLTAITENMAIYVNHPGGLQDWFYYYTGDGYQIIGDQDNDNADILRITGWDPDEVILTRNNDAPVRNYNYNARNGEELVRTYDDLQLEFPDGKTILLKYVLEGSNRGIDEIRFDGIEPTWTKAYMIEMARSLATQSSEDQFFPGLVGDDSYIYSRGDGHDTIFEGDDASNDILALRGIWSSDVIVSYSNASNSYINASDYGVGDIAYPDLLLEVGGRGANGSVLLALGAVDGFGIERVLFDSNNNGITDAGEMLWNKADMLAAADANDVYVFNPGDYSSYHYGEYWNAALDGDGGTDTLRLTGVGEDEVRVRRGHGVHVYIEDYDNSFTLKVQIRVFVGIERVHFDKNGNGIEDDGDDSVLTRDELLSAATDEDMAIYVDHGGGDTFYYNAGDGHQLIGDEDNSTGDLLFISGWGPDDVTLTRNAEDLVRDYNARNGEDLVRTYDDLQLEFRDGKTILLKHALDGSYRGVEHILLDSNGDGLAETTWDKVDIIAMARDLVIQSSEDQFFHGFSFAEDNSYIYSQGDGHDTIFEGRNKGNDVLELKGGISSSDITVSYSNAASGYYDEYPDLLIELGGRGDAATGSVLLALGAVDGYGIESVLFDSNGNGRADDGEILWDKDYMIAAAEATAAAENDVYVFDPGRYSRYPGGYHYDEDADGGIDTLSLTGIGADEVRVRRGYYGGYDDAVYIDAYDNSFTLKVQLGGDDGIERVHFDQNGNGIEDGDDSILTKDELLTMAATEDMAIYVNHPDDSYSDYFYYHAGDGHQIIGDQDNGDADLLNIYGWFDDEVILTRNNDAPVRDYNARNGEDLVRTYDDLQLEFPDGKTILLKYVLDGSNRGVDEIYFHGIETRWTKTDMIAMARALVTQSSDDQFFHGFSFAEDNSYEYSRGDGHDTIFEDYHAGNDVLVLKGGISSGDVTVSYSNAGRSYIDASDYGAGDIAYPDLLIELGGIGDAATGSVLLVLGAVDGYGVESVLFDENGNGIKDGNEISWDKDEMLAAADATAAADLFG